MPETPVHEHGDLFSGECEIGASSQSSEAVVNPITEPRAVEARPECKFWPCIALALLAHAPYRFG